MKSTASFAVVDDLAVETEQTEDDDQADISRLVNKDEIKRISDIVNKSENISIGDVHYMLSIYKEIVTTYESKLYVYSVKLTYNIMLLDYNLRNEFAEKQILIGGGFYNPIAQLVTKNKGYIPSYDRKWYDFDKLKNHRLMDLDSDKWGKSSSEIWLFLIKDYYPIKRMDGTFKGAKKSDFMEFYIENYRNLDSIYYSFEGYESKFSYALFDILAFMYNLNRVDSIKEHANRMSSGKVDGEYFVEISKDFYQFDNVFLIQELLAYKYIQKKSIEKTSEFLMNYYTRLIEFEGQSKVIEYNSFATVNYLKYLKERINKIIYYMTKGEISIDEDFFIQSTIKINKKTTYGEPGSKSSVEQANKIISDYKSTPNIKLTSLKTKFDKFCKKYSAEPFLNQINKDFKDSINRMPKDVSPDIIEKNEKKIKDDLINRLRDYTKSVVI